MAEWIRTLSVWGTVITLAAFSAGALLQKKTNLALLNPILSASVFVICALLVFRIPYSDYKESNSVVTFFLLPATVSLAVPLHEQWQLLKKNILAVLVGISSGVIVSIGSCIIICRFFDLDFAVAVSFLPKSVTTAIGTDISQELGGFTALTTSLIILTGVVGNTLAVWLCKKLSITHPIAQGIAIGTSSHAIGTSKAMEIGQIQGAMSGLSIAVAGVLTAILCPFIVQFL